jgi:2-polyprenyl-6-methoxyphenol hydroxylase-like FAD-dependent oxidoreductase
MNASSPRDTGVLIVGAGPTGLVLALWLARLGVPLRIIDKTSEPGTTSRALAVQARTLEFYSQLGFADSVVAHGRRTIGVSLWVAGKRAARAVFGEIGEGLSPFPYALVFPQDEHERLLVDQLAKLGIQVERQTELLAFEEKDNRIIAVLKHANGLEETCAASYIAGCDGARSTVRQTLQLDFPGGTYDHLFYVADVEATGEVLNGELHAALDRTDFLAIFPLHDPARVRLVGTIRQHATNHNDNLTWADVSQRVLDWIPINVKNVHWFSTYRVHHRVADHFRKGRAFILGDAGHVHSPVGGQGMNTGIGDAVNLSWKLAAVLRGRVGVSLLDTFEMERIAFARRLVATTDRAFTGVTSPSFFARLIRLRLGPALMSRFVKIRAFRRLMFRTISQTNLDYRHSSLSQGRAGSVRGGDRLPWFQLAAIPSDNFAPLSSLDWQVHIYGQPSPEIQSLCAARKLPLRFFPWQAGMSKSGLHRDAVYFIRPDGYVALADAAASPATLAAYLDSRHISLANEPSARPI